MKKYFLLTVLLMTLAAIGCRFSQPVGTYAYDFPAAEASKNISEKKMHDSIVKGCADAGWRGVRRLGLSPHQPDLLAARRALGVVPG